MSEGEVAVVGLGRSGVSAARLLAREGHRVYVTDSSESEAVQKSAQSLLHAGIGAETGAHDLDRIARASFVVASPGVPPHAGPLVTARNAGVEIVSEIEVALRALPRLKYIAVTGTNGKSTTTAMIGAMLRALGHDAPEVGNIGTPLSELALRDNPPEWAALELSSFQLHDTPSVKPTVGVLTNLAPDHLDRYPDVESYYADKALMFRNARSDSRWVTNADDHAVEAMTSSLRGTRARFSLAGKRSEARYDAKSEQLVLFDEVLLERRKLPLLGDHNVANALAAALAVSIADDAHRTPEARARIAGALESMRSLPHRLEVVGEFGGVQWINDSKATNVGSTLVAVQGMTRPTVLLLGGRHKGEPYTALAEPLKRIGRAVVAYGEAGPRIEADLKGLVPLERLESSFEHVVARARALARPGDAILLSPACSSYDMFANYEARGAEFRRLAAASGSVTDGGER